MTTPYTPGPWRNDGSVIIAQLNHGGRKTQIAETFRDCGVDQCNANAQLIAAAPKLLAALETMLADYKAEIRRNQKLAKRTQEVDFAKLPIVVRAEAAIAKAKGVQS